MDAHAPPRQPGLQHLARIGDAGVTVTGATGVTVNATPGQKLRAKYSAGTAILYSGDTWLVVGDLSS